jgi:hypothetical protein
MSENTWRELCEAIMREKNPKKLLVLVDALNRELDQREKELRHDSWEHPPPPDETRS